ncbi:unnamed protein product [Protopolystoma xenopodis]|uniref:Uncharacterized protein n=1 Tax=Protopolystoma xenopodis TaxID=117903 RepID=A0A448X099_9PLAT|nr:unnamed protein product [Protopolystoma xenopodis]
MVHSSHGLPPSGKVLSASFQSDNSLVIAGRRVAQVVHPSEIMCTVWSRRRAGMQLCKNMHVL